jgi:hypothetical protein
MKKIILLTIIVLAVLVLIVYRIPKMSLAMAVLDNHAELPETYLNWNEKAILKDNLDLFSLQTDSEIDSLLINQRFYYPIREPQSSKKTDVLPIIQREVISGISLPKDRVFSVSISGKVAITEVTGFARFILITEDDTEYLIFGSDFFFLSPGTSTFSNICDETCVFEEPVRIKSLEVEFYKASPVLDRIFFQTSKPVREDLALSQYNARMNLLRQIILDKKLGWVAGETSVSKEPYKDLKKRFVGHNLYNLWGFHFYKGGIFNIPKE